MKYKANHCYQYNSKSKTYYLNVNVDNDSTLRGPWLFEYDNFIEFIDSNRPIHNLDKDLIECPKEYFDKKFNEFVAKVNDIFNHNSIEYNPNENISLNVCLEYVNKAYYYSDGHSNNCWHYIHKIKYDNITKKIIAKDCFEMSQNGDTTLFSFYDIPIEGEYALSIKQDMIDKTIFIDKFNEIIQSVRNKYGIKND
jgi:hypothetical protein